jgi:uncharacterized delta-60 repeat protein
MTRAWVKSYDGPGQGSDNAFAIGVNAAGEVFVAGESAGTAGSPYAYDFVTLKFSTVGVCLWTNRFHGAGTGNDIAHGLALDSAGDVLVTGESSGLSTRTDFATVKYSGQGVPLWTNRYRAAADSAIARAIAIDGNDDAYVTGYTYASGLVTIKYSSEGVPLWTNVYLGPVNQGYASSIALDGHGKVFVSGFSTGNGTSDDFVTLAYSTAGAGLWTNRYDGPDSGSDQANAMAVDVNGNAFVAGGTAASGLTEFVAIKYSNNGAPLWTNRYRGGGSRYGGASDVVLDAAGNVFLAGSSIGSGTYGDFVTLKYSNDGIPLWTNRYVSSYDDAVNSLTLDPNGNVFVTGYFTDSSGIAFDLATVAYSNDGTWLWTDTYNGPANNDDSGNAIAPDRSGNVFVTGYSRATNGYADIVLLKYSTTLVSPPLQVQRTANPMVLSWANTLFSLQSATSLSSTFTNIPGATSPYSNSLSGSPRYFRLRGN